MWVCLDAGDQGTGHGNQDAGRPNPETGASTRARKRDARPAPRAAGCPPLRQLIRMAVAASILVVAALGSLQAEPKAPEKGSRHTEHSVTIQQCAKACSDCQRACDQCATHCVHLLRDGKVEHMATLMSCQDCADACVAAAKIVSREGPAAKQICQACADVCALCAQRCEKFPDDKHMKACAEECRKPDGSNSV